MSKFRLAILDYSKEQLDKNAARQIYNHIIFEKQKNFLRTEPNYVVTDKHDMIGTHYLIYDHSDFLDPKLIFAIRTTYLHRAEQHKIPTPLQALVPTLDPQNQAHFEEFQSKHPHLVDCNAWFVHPDYSKKTSGLSLSDIGYFMVTMNVLRHGYDNIVGCTNETYNASRWLKNVGDFAHTENFIHPAIQAPHKMILVSNFNLEHAAKVYAENKELIDEVYEVFPEALKHHQTLPEFIQSYFAENRIRPNESERAA